MEVTLDQALQKGIEAYKAGKVREADRYYTAILKAQPNHPDANYYMGVLAVGIGKIEEALPFFKKALDAKSNIPQFWLRYIDALIKLDRLDDAQIEFNLAKKNKVIDDRFHELEKKLFNFPSQPEVKFEKVEELIQKNDIKAAQRLLKSLAHNYSNSFIWNKLSAQCMFKVGSASSANKFYQRCLDIEPKSPVIHKEMGNVFLSLNLNSKAIKHYKKAIEIKSDYAHPYNNIAALLTERGLIGQAIKYYTKAIQINRSFPPANQNLSSLLVQLNKPPNMNNLINLACSFHWEEHFHDFRVSMNGAIYHYARGEIKNCNAFLKKAIQSVTPELINNLNEKEKLFYGTYQDYLKKLLKCSPKQNINNKSDYIYHVGESHCFSYAHHYIKIKNKNFKIIPNITFGAKAFHFSVSENNRFKAITKINLASIPKGSIVFISFGEIDCRPIEGFIPAAEKLNKPIKRIISETVNDYLDWFWVQNNTNNHKLFFFNIPAPCFDNKYSVNLNSDVSKAVQLFNTELELKILNYEFNLIDVFKFTVGDNGFSNKLFHLDKSHLGPDAISEIEKQF